MESAETLDRFYSKYRTIEREELSLIIYDKPIGHCNFQQLRYIDESFHFLMETPLKWWNGLARDERVRFLRLLEE